MSEQVEALRGENIIVDYFLIKGKGLLGYLRNLTPLRRKIAKGNYNIIHAHYGLSGLLACLQRRRPVVVTFHTGEQFKWYINILASFSVLLARKCIFVSHSTYKEIFLRIQSKSSIIPCGVNTEEFKPIANIDNLKIAAFKEGKINILFASDFTGKKFYKNPKLAIDAVRSIKNANLIELKGYSREEVNLLLNVCDLMLLTSRIEGSPQIVKEAMACNCPVVATDVGDIKEIFDNLEGYYISDFSVEGVVQKISYALKNTKRTQGRNRILEKYDNRIIAKQVIEVYQSIINQN